MVQSMVVIGLWATEKPASQSAARDLHDNLDVAIREQRVSVFLKLFWIHL